jgi:hypothetical protein
LKVSALLVNIPNTAKIGHAGETSLPKVTEVPKMKLLQVAAAMLVMSCCACAYLRGVTPEKTASPMVRELASAHQKLRIADEASPHVLFTEIGRVVYADFEAPFWYVVYRPFKPELLRVLISAGIQGDASAGVECLLELIGGLSASSPDAAAYDLDILPIVNPWGYVFNRPFNRNGVEIGQDFSTFDSAEARLVRRFLREKQYDLVIDLREDPEATGFFVWQYGPTEKNASAQVVRRIRSSGFPVESDAGLILLRPRDGIVAAPMWGLGFLRLLRQLTLAGYVRQNVSSGVYTIVTPQRAPLADRMAMQRMAIETLLHAYQKNP